MRKGRQADNVGRTIAFTFDDGPHAQKTPKLLDIAAEAAIKLTFFLVGQRVGPNSHIVQRQVAEGHELGNHSWSHPDLTTLDAGTLLAEVQSTNKIILEHSGVRPCLFRPPYGRITDAQQELLKNELGCRTILWTIDSLDWRTRSAAAVSTRILREARQGSIVLFHDIQQASIEAMSLVLQSLLSDGYEFVTVSDLLHRAK